MYAVPIPKAISAPSTPADVRHAAAVLWSGGTSYRVTDPKSGRSVQLDVASAGGRTRLQLTTSSIVIWLGNDSTSTKPTFVCVKIPPGKTSCNPPAATKSTAQDLILAATRPLLVYSSLIAPGALTGAKVRTTHEAGYPVGCIQGRSKAGLGTVRLCTTRDGLLTEVDYKGVRVQAIGVSPVVTAADLARPA
ncbi:MAG: hypothetical protein ABI317_00645 [Gaiellales bacterium]